MIKRTLNIEQRKKKKNTMFNKKQQQQLQHRGKRSCIQSMQKPYYEHNMKMMARRWAKMETVQQ